MKTCPLLKKACIEHACMFWTHLTGKHPQTGRDIDEFDCSVKWLPILLIEGARHTQGVQAAVESMRNEVVVRQNELNNLITQASRRASASTNVDHDDPPRISAAQEINGR